MVNILHKVGVKASTPGAVYKALATLEGLSGKSFLETGKGAPAPNETTLARWE
jgi:hypothetical protein